jgi:hypothetical protein
MQLYRDEFFNINSWFFSVIFIQSIYTDYANRQEGAVWKGTTFAKIGLIWFSDFKGEDLNVNVYDVRRTDDRLQVMIEATKASLICILLI